MAVIGGKIQGKHSRKKAPSETWLCIRFTHLALNSMGIELNSELPAAITDKQQIWQSNLTSIKTGVKPGMSINHALMLTPNIRLIEREQHKEAKKRQELSFWAYRFTSLVCIHSDDSLLLEVGRSIKLFNGLNHLLHLINNDLAGFRISACLGLAHTPKAAYLLSFSAQISSNEAQRENYQTRLQQCLISDLEVNSKIIDQLHHCGLETLLDLEGIPKAELGQRFGADLLHYLEQLWGTKADPQIGTTPPETFHSSADFAEPISNLNWINQQLDRLLSNLEHFITERQLVCRSFSWRFFHENNRLLQTVAISLSAKQNKFDTFRELTDLKLASLKLNWEFSSIELSSSQLVPLQLFNDDLFDPQPDQEQFKQLIDKLSNRLGDQALFRVNNESEHLPELANGRQHVIQETLQEVAAPYFTEENTEHKYQPLWLLENPQRLAQRHRQPLHDGPLNLIHGPDRITSHWWAKLQSRDYFIARQRNGRLLWIFFDRNNKQWFLQGLFS